MQVQGDFNNSLRHYFVRLHDCFHEFVVKIPDLKSIKVEI